MALKMTTIATSIAAISVTGIDILDITEIPAAGTTRDTPYIMPRPDKYITGFGLEVNSFGGGDTALMTVKYTLNYRLLNSKIGEGRSNIFDTYSNFVTNVGLFLDALILNDAVSGALDSRPFDIGEFGPVADPTGNIFHGCDIGIIITELVN